MPFEVRPVLLSFDFLVHSVGDGATSEALAAVAASADGVTQTRHRLTHIEIIDKADYAKFKELGVFADFQVLIQREKKHPL